MADWRYDFHPEVQRDRQSEENRYQLWKSTGLLLESPKQPTNWRTIARLVAVAVVAMLGWFGLSWFGWIG